VLLLQVVVSSAWTRILLLQAVVSSAWTRMLLLQVVVSGALDYNYRCCRLW
jgi:hypothetical protein